MSRHSTFQQFNQLIAGGAGTDPRCVLEKLAPPIQIKPDMVIINTPFAKRLRKTRPETVDILTCISNHHLTLYNINV